MTTPDIKFETEYDSHCRSWIISRTEWCPPLHSPESDQSLLVPEIYWDEFYELVQQRNEYIQERKKAKAPR